MKQNYVVEFEVQPGIYQNVIGDYVEASSTLEALVLARQWLVDNGMDPLDALELSARNRISMEGDDKVWTF